MKDAGVSNRSARVLFAAHFPRNIVPCASDDGATYHVLHHISSLMAKRYVKKKVMELLIQLFPNWKKLSWLWITVDLVTTVGMFFCVMKKKKKGTAKHLGGPLCCIHWYTEVF